MRPSVLVTRDPFPETLEYLARHCEVEANPVDAPYDRDTLVARLQGKAGAQIFASERIDADLLERCPELRALCNTAVGYNNIDVEACTRRGIAVTNTPGVLDDTVADLAIGLMIAACRRFSEAERIVRAGAWKRSGYKDLLGRDVHGATLGILGLGRIGAAIARRALGFGMRIVYHGRGRAAPEVERALGATWMAKADLLAAADVLMLILPYTRETHHCIGAAELALMRPDAVLVNVARGGIVDDAALVEALRAGRLASAGLDVYEDEPRLHPGLLALENVVLLPHIGSASERTRRAMAMTAARNLVAAVTGRTPPDLVNPECRANARA